MKLFDGPATAALAFTAFTLGAILFSQHPTRKEPMNVNFFAFTNHSAGGKTYLFIDRITSVTVKQESDPHGGTKTVYYVYVGAAAYAITEPSEQAEFDRRVLQ